MDKDSVEDKEVIKVLEEIKDLEVIKVGWEMEIKVGLVLEIKVVLVIIKVGYRK